MREGVSIGHSVEVEKGRGELKGRGVSVGGGPPKGDDRGWTFSLSLDARDGVRRLSGSGDIEAAFSEQA